MIRPATAADIRALAEIQVRGWRWAYADIVPAQEMPDVETREAQWRELPLDGTWVWDQDGAVAGFACGGPSRDEDAGPGVGELYALYVDPPAQGAGVGAALLEHAIDALREAGCAEVTLWIFSANGHAREFYAARGWRPDGAHMELLGAPALRLRRDLR
jgi:GNAT superfamily N-acetyltransferase